MTAWSLNSAIRLTDGGISIPEAERQQRTANGILERLKTQPGVILADEVGMGKTFVALAVLASVAWATGKPAVVMAPPRLIKKWGRDATRFREHCLAVDEGGKKQKFECRIAETGAAFLKCFDDPPERACQLVLLANTALHRDERDPWVRLAAMKRALTQTKNPDSTRRVVARFAHNLLPNAELGHLEEAHFAELLSRRVDGWRSYLASVGLELDDDPVPMPFVRALSDKNLSGVTQALETVPLRVTDNFDARIRNARKAVSSALKEVWSEALAHAKIDSPLLIFDEAHHLKNGDTRLAQLFQAPESGDTSVISGAFDRMVFLTATPFQLGHSELVEVLRRFQAVRWESVPGVGSSERFAQGLDALDEALTRAQSEALALDRAWGQLPGEDYDLDAQGELTPEAQQKVFECDDEIGAAAVVSTQYRKVRVEFKRTEALLRPWVVRHLRDRQMQTDDGPVARRRSVTGRGIQDGEPNLRGLEMTGATRFPFLLCARAQGVLAHHSNRRAYFAEGLASSYGAFKDTIGAQGRPTDDADIGLAGDDPLGHVGWYVQEVENLLGEQRNPASHPKIAATVDRAIEEWKSGHKVLIFGHYRKTIEDLTTAIEDRLVVERKAMAAKALGMTPEEAEGATDRIGKRLQEPNGLLHKEVRAQLEIWIQEFGRLEPEHTDRIVSLLLTTLSEHTFIVRNFPLDRLEVRESLQAERPTVEQARDAARAVVESLRLRKGKGRPSFQARVQAFLRHLADDLSSSQERAEALDTLDRGPRLGVVEKAYGLTDEAARQRRLLGFNSPLLPEILVVSEVMAEGLDLHLDCRHVIHHDLSWNPSTLEQRTGRVDRLRCRAEVDGQSINIFLPYLEGTADEKMYRVVSDRARWFQVVMGERYQVDEASTEALARRVPFPESRARELMFDLRVRE